MAYCDSSAALDESLLDSTSLADVCTGSTLLVFMSILNAWARSNDKISGASKRIKPVATTLDEYDFIVVGGGAGGAPAAARLSENPDWKVLLLEAGPDEPAAAGIPGVAFNYLASENVWNYQSVNETACCQAGASCSWVSGKNLGGNTAHNAMIYLRGHPDDYDAWAADGNEGWSWADVEPIFIKSEDNGEIDRVGTTHHGTGGPLSVERFPHAPAIVDDILAAATELGYSINEDLNGEDRTGFSIIQATNKKGVRCSSATAFLRPIRDRENLHISLESYVTRVIVEDGVATGVEYYKDGVYKTISASREIIISGGTVGTPNVLLHSGIGPKADLEAVGIDVVLDLPGVGENLQDHANTPIRFTVDEPDTYDNNWAVATEYMKTQTGPMSSVGTIQVLGMVSTNKTTPEYPDLEIYFKGYLAACASGEVGGVSTTGKRTVIILPSLLRPASRGKVSLTSNDTFALPKILVNYLVEEDDLNRMIDGAKMIMDFVNTDALSSYNFTLSNVEGCSEYEIQSDDWWICVIRQENYALYHQVGTSKMGPASDSMAVVDPRLRVHGIKGLRVADASIMPKEISSNTQAATIMIGERVAEFIKQDWDLKYAESYCSSK